MEIIKKLNLNKHPHAAEDYSLVCAKNVKLSSDCRSIRNEEGVYNNEIIHNKLTADFYDSQTEQSVYEIVGVIPCNDELVIFVVGSDREHGAIYRYKENVTGSAACFNAYSKFVWEGEEIQGTFTYNIEGDLIICFGENNDSDAPYSYMGYGHELRTIKLHNYDYNYDESNDLDWEKTTLCPEVPYCACSDIIWTEGHAYKGYYEFYIRYKIDDDNYTQWFYINAKPLVDEVERTQISKIVYADINAQDRVQSGILGCAALTSNNADLCNISLQLNLKFGITKTVYNAFQIGYIITSKDYTKAFITKDLFNVIDGNIRDYTFKINHSNDLEYSPEQLTTSYYNYNNVKNIINYDNRVYISNYTESRQNITKNDLLAVGYNLDSNVSIGYKGYADSELPSSVGALYPIDHIVDNKLDKRNTLLYGEVYDFYIHFVDKYGAVTNGIRLENTKAISNRFEVFENTEGHKLFKVPDTITLTYQEEYTAYDEFGNPYIAFRNVTSKDPYLAINFQINSLPSCYVAAFISYAKFEKRRKLTGIVCNGNLYNGYIISSDKINLNANILVDSYTLNYQWQNYNTNFLNTRVPLVYDQLHIINEMELVNYSESVDIDTTFIIAPDSIKDDNLQKAGYIQLGFDGRRRRTGQPGTIPNSGSITNGFSLANKLYSLVYNKQDLYIKRTKELIPTSSVAWLSGTTIYNLGVTDNFTGYNGFWCWDEFFIYNKNGFLLNTANGQISNGNGEDLTSARDSTVYNDSYTVNQTPLIFYSIYYQWDYPLHIKKVNNDSKIQFYTTEEISASDKNKILTELIVEPKDTIDLFVYPHPNKSDVMSNKLFSEYNENLPETIVYNKIVRRSNVLQNESLVNAWRQFPVEGYKLIDENKGNIVKLIAANQLFLVHCEHSLFGFDTSNKMQTIDKDIQLYQPDAFEVQYQEIFTTDKGFAGLKHRHHGVFDTFGYVFYDVDSSTVYRYSDKSLKVISLSIQDWLQTWRPTNCRFAVDVENSRILIRFNFVYDINDETQYFESINGELQGRDTYTDNNSAIATLSYNFNSDSFISLHDYTFGFAYNTKTKVYFIKDGNGTITDLVEFYKDDHFGEFHACLPKGSTDTYDNKRVGNVYYSHIEIHVNTSYEEIKFLEYIKYRLFKYKNPQTRSSKSISVNARTVPWSGDYLQIFNKDVNSGEIDISVEDVNKFNRYKKPYYELTEWNFNYFRNAITTHSKTSPSDYHRRLYGNWFVVSFIFTNQDNLPIEFETLDCIFSKLRK